MALQVALQKIQSAFEGEAERTGLISEDDVVDLVNEVRKENYLMRRVRINEGYVRYKCIDFCDSSQEQDIKSRFRDCVIVCNIMV